MNLEYLKKTDNVVYNVIQSELDRQRNTLELIASENFTSKSILESVGGSHKDSSDKPTDVVENKVSDNLDSEENSKEIEVVQE